MLKVFFGDKKEAIYNTSVYFKNTFLDEWITDPLSIEMIKDVDKSVVIGPHMMKVRCWDQLHQESCPVGC